MTDQECIQFLQWAMPRLGLRWPGFRKVRRQVHKRINRRLKELGLTRISDYRAYLETHPSESSVLDSFCRISISRFYRDRGVFDRLRDEVLPELAVMVRNQGKHHVRAWSAGCASGEEPYTLSILWNECVQPMFPGLQLHQVATDVDEQVLRRAREARYPASSLKDLPSGWRKTAFAPAGTEYVLRPDFRLHVEFQQQDLRNDAPTGSFHLVLCRNLVFTYFASELQRQVLQRILEHTIPGGFLVVGKQEVVPERAAGLLPHNATLGIYRAGRTGSG
jgi:chemotaxis protein methyltransferase CheR